MTHPDDEQLPERLFTPESPLSDPTALLGYLLRDARLSLSIARALVIRNIKAKYRQSALGYVWLLIPPILMAVIWTALREQGLLQAAPDLGIPYGAFVLTGIILWQAFADAAQAPLRAVAESKALLSKQSLPYEALIFAAFGEVMFNVAVRLLVLVGALLWFGIGLDPGALLALPALIMIVVLGITLGLLLTPIGMLYGDVGFVMQSGLQFLFLLTPIIYLPPETFPASLVNVANPLSPMLIAARDWLLFGYSSWGLPLLLDSLLVLVALALALLVYRISMPILVERMGS